MKINLLVAFLFASVCLNAQINKGAVSIGGDAWANFGKNKTVDPSQQISKTESFSFSPSLGWAVKDNLLVGGRLLINFVKNDYPSGNTSSKNRNLGASIWARKYLPLGKSFFFFTEANFGGYSISVKQTDSQIPVYYYKENGFALSANAYPGLSYHVKKNLFLETALNNVIMLGYNKTNTELKNQDGSVRKGSNNNFGFSTSLSSGVPLQVGFRWIIAKK